MISLCSLVKDTPDLGVLVRMFADNYKGEFEVCIGDNSKEPNEYYQELADEYIRITDKELFRGGIPAAHNRIAIECANTYKIVYLDSDEYPIWVHPDLEDMFDLNYVIPLLRAEFFTNEEINTWSGMEYDEIIKTLEQLRTEGRIAKDGITTQDRIYNCRYAKFDGLCHSIFHVPEHFRGQNCGMIALHNKTVRDTKNKERMDELIYEQYMRQNINNFLSSSPLVLGWGKRIRKHRFQDWREWNEFY